MAWSWCEYSSETLDRDAFGSLKESHGESGFDDLLVDLFYLVWLILRSGNPFGRELVKLMSSKMDCEIADFKNILYGTCLSSHASGNDHEVGANRGVGENEGVDGVPDLSIIIAQQLQNLLPTILTPVGNHGNNPENIVNNNIQGDVRNVIVNNDMRGCTYKEFLACNSKEYDGKGSVVVYTRWIEKMELV
ncbi:hypothetical protein Tco_0115947 [Tanacetum coccineum]